MHENPYAAELGSAAPLTAMAESLQLIRTLVERWPTDCWERSYAPGKWTARQILAHLVQTELVLTTRVRFAASQHDYQAQPFSQDDFVGLDDQADGPTAVAAYAALRAFNLSMFRHLTPEQRGRTFMHPEYGELTPDWVAAQLAGHDIHHLRQLQAIE